MSGFFGVFSPVGKINRPAFEKMQKAIHRQGYDELESHIDDCIAMGHSILRFSKESCYGQQPLKSSCGRYLLAGHFRLDYRDELGDKLGLTQDELEVTADSVLVMSSYIKWGEQCVRHLEGDWAFVLYNCQNTSLFCAKDKIGYSSFFYHQSQDQIYFSSDLDVLVSVLTKVEVDIVQLYLMGFGRNYITQGSTLYKNVFFLHPSTSLKINKGFQYVVQKNTLFESINTRLYKSEYDYILDFKSSFQVALKSKIYNLKKIGIYLSGGFDSVLVAKSTDLQCVLSKQKIHSFTRTPIEVDKSAEGIKIDHNEFTVIEKFIHDFSQTQFHSSAYEHVLTSEFLNPSIPVNSFNPIVTANTYWLEGIMREAKYNGLSVLLVGQFGNYTLSWDAPSIDIFDSFFSLIKNYLKILMNRYLVQNNIFNKNTLLTFWQKIYIAIVLLKRQKFFFNSKSLRLYLLKHNAFDLGARHYQRGFQNKLIVVDPTADERVLIMSLSFPEKLFNKQHISKYIFKESFKRLLHNEFISISTSNINQALNFKYKIDRDLNFKSRLQELIKIYHNDKNINIHFLQTCFQENDAEEDLQKIADVNVIHLLRHVSLLYFYQKKFNFNS